MAFPHLQVILQTRLIDPQLFLHNLYDIGDKIADYR